MGRNVRGVNQDAAHGFNLDYTLLTKTNVKVLLCENNIPRHDKRSFCTMSVLQDEEKGRTRKHKYILAKVI